nr:G-type lectin S-receptor-like serine/threonine-protein kinase At4g27290 isoform X1 [Ipomoea batatas]
MLTFYIWNNKKKGWFNAEVIQGDQCDTYGTCGFNSVCNANRLSPCDCLDGFQPVSRLEWESLQWSSGCVRGKPLNCSDEGFRRLSGIKLPDNSRLLGNRTSMRSSTDCEKECLGNCSCSAYAWAESVGCAVWYGDLKDMKWYYNEGQELYVRMPASELIGYSKKGRHQRALMASLVSIIIGLVFLSVTTWYGFHAMAARRKRRGEYICSLRLIQMLSNWLIGNEESLELLGDSIELPMIGFDELVAATNHFSDDNKLGAGGFGPVYKVVMMVSQLYCA